MRNSVVLPAPFGADETDLLALLERRGGLDEEDLMTILLGDVVETNHMHTPGKGCGRSYAMPRACGRAF